MHLVQMAARCPESRYLGRGILHDFKWQINIRGVANIIKSRGSYVEGLCYLLSQKDEKKLDKNEGVPTAYEKSQMDVEVVSAKATVVGRRVSEVNEQTQLERRFGENHQPESFNNSASPERILALVYINYGEQRNGEPRPEYIGRMNSAVQDALHLGVSSGYLEKEIQLVIQLQLSRAEASTTQSEGVKREADRPRTGRQSGRSSQYSDNTPALREVRQSNRGNRGVVRAPQYSDEILIPRESDEVRQSNFEDEDVMIADATHQSSTQDDFEVLIEN